MKRFPTFLLAATLVAASFLAAGCGTNVFKPFGKTSGDAQHASAGAAALDRGDFEKASEEFAAVAENADLASSGQVYTTLAKYGVGMKQIAGAFGLGKDAGIGKSITTLANSVGTSNGETARLEIFHAYKQALNINSKPLKGFTRFLSALALMAETLAEGASDSTHLATTDLAATPSGCTSSDPATGCGLAQAAACGKPSGSKLTSGPALTPIDLTTATDADLQNAAKAPTLRLIQAAITEISAGLTDLGKGGSLASSFDAFNTTVGGISAFSGDAPCFREILLDQKIGSY